MRKLLPAIFVMAFLISAAQKEDTSIANQPGVKMVSVRQGKYKVFTQKVGSGTNKLLLVPGGPGASFEYFEVFPLWLKDDYEIYYYSPLGSYLSDRLSDSTLQTLDGYVEELEEVRQALGLENFYVLGHSWAGRLVLTYAAKYQKHLRGLIVSNATGLGAKMIDVHGRQISDYDYYQQRLIADIAETQPDLRQYSDALRNCFITKTTQPKLMDSIMKVIQPLFVKKHFLRLPTPPEALVNSRKHSIGESKMHWLIEDTQEQDPLPVLSAITVPTLFIGGKYDYIPPKYEEARHAMKNAKDVTIYIAPNGSHRSMWDDPENYFQAVELFVEKINKQVR
jgi:proline iminopeptidase